MKPSMESLHLQLESLHVSELMPPPKRQWVEAVAPGGPPPMTNILVETDDEYEVLDDDAFATQLTSVIKQECPAAEISECDVGCSNGVDGWIADMVMGVQELSGEADVQLGVSSASVIAGGHMFKTALKGMEVEFVDSDVDVIGEDELQRTLLKELPADDDVDAGIDDVTSIAPVHPNVADDVVPSDTAKEDRVGSIGITDQTDNVEEEADDHDGVANGGEWIDTANRLMRLMSGKDSDDE
eukprot:5897478-Amphidinium_carterae.1